MEADTVWITLFTEKVTALNECGYFSQNLELVVAIVSQSIVEKSFQYKSHFKEPTIPVILRRIPMTQLVPFL